MQAARKGRKDYKALPDLLDLKARKVRKAIKVYLENWALSVLRALWDCKESPEKWGPQVLKVRAALRVLKVPPDHKAFPVLKANKVRPAHKAPLVSA